MFYHPHLTSSCICLIVHEDEVKDMDHCMAAYNGTHAPLYVSHAAYDFICLTCIAEYTARRPKSGERRGNTSRKAIKLLAPIGGLGLAARNNDSSPDELSHSTEDEDNEDDKNDKGGKGGDDDADQHGHHDHDHDDDDDDEDGDGDGIDHNKEDRSEAIDNAEAIDDDDVLPIRRRHTKPHRIPIDRTPSPQPAIPPPPTMVSLLRERPTTRITSSSPCRNQSSSSNMLNISNSSINNSIVSTISGLPIVLGPTIDIHPVAVTVTQNESDINADEADLEQSINILVDTKSPVPTAPVSLPPISLGDPPLISIASQLPSIPSPPTPPAPTPPVTSQYFNHVWSVPQRIFNDTGNINTANTDSRKRSTRSDNDNNESEKRRRSAAHRDVHTSFSDLNGNASLSSTPQTRRPSVAPVVSASSSSTSTMTTGSSSASASSSSSTLISAAASSSSVSSSVDDKTCTQTLKSAITDIDAAPDADIYQRIQRIFQRFTSAANIKLRLADIVGIWGVNDVGQRVPVRQELFRKYLAHWSTNSVFPVLHYNKATKQYTLRPGIYLYNTVSDPDDDTSSVAAAAAVVASSSMSTSDWIVAKSKAETNRNIFSRAASSLAASSTISHERKLSRKVLDTWPNDHRMEERLLKLIAHLANAPDGGGFTLVELKAKWRETADVSQQCYNETFDNEIIKIFLEHCCERKYISLDAGIYSAGMGFNDVFESDVDTSSPSSSSSSSSSSSASAPSSAAPHSKYNEIDLTDMTDDEISEMKPFTTLAIVPTVKPDPAVKEEVLVTTTLQTVSSDVMGDLPSSVVHRVNHLFNMLQDGDLFETNILEYWRSRGGSSEDNMILTALGRWVQQGYLQCIIKPKGKQYSITIQSAYGTST
jgi:hypothetical protein